MAEHVFEGTCSRCRRQITARVALSAGDLRFPVSPPPVMGSYCNCGDKDAPGGLSGQAVPLTLRGLPD